MKCIITGVGGVVGGNLGLLLAANYEWDVVGIGRSGSEGASYFKVDLSLRNDVMRAAERIRSGDVVVHCAALIDNSCNAADIFSANVVGTVNALALAKNLGAKYFINISSVPVVGRPTQIPISEDCACNPLTVYHLSKLHAESVVNCLHSHGLNAVSFRIPSPVGLNMPPRSIVPILTNQAIGNRTIRLTGDRRRRQNFLDLRDLAMAIATLATVESISGIYNIASMKTYGNLELARLIVDAAKSDSVIVDEMDDPGGFYEDWEISCAKANRDFGYSARHNLDETLRWILPEA